MNAGDLSPRYSFSHSDASPRRKRILAKIPLLVVGLQPIRRDASLSMIHSDHHATSCHHCNARVGLDLVRTLAIVLVLLSHIGGFSAVWAGRAAPHWLMMSGFFGVELFFALSGFLIGGLLLDLVEWDASFRGWARFTARRWARTLPLYWPWIDTLAVVWRPPTQLVQHILSYGSATQNLLWPMPQDAWFAVSWSLRVCPESVTLDYTVSAASGGSTRA